MLTEDGDQRFDAFVKRTLGHEGGYVDDPNDAGGQTNYGITQATLDQYRATLSPADAANLSVSVADLTTDQARQVYKTLYYDQKRIGDIADDTTAAQIFDLGVNHSPKAAGLIVQKAILDVLPSSGIALDGIVGSKTIAILNQSPPATLLRIDNSMVDERIAYYRRLAQNDPSQQKFLNGWIARAESYRPAGMTPTMIA